MSTRRAILLLHLILFVALSRSSHAIPAYEPLASFQAAPQYPSRGALLLVEEADCFFGTSIQGGRPGFGTLYKISRAGKATVLVQFTGFRDLFPGDRPSDGLWHDGSGGYGQIFRLRFGPTPVTLPADGINFTSAVIHGTVNPNRTASAAGFDISVLPDFSSFLPYPVNKTTSGSVPEPISATLTGLVPGTTYYFRARAGNAENSQTQTGQLLSFTTRKPGLADWLAGYGLAGPAALPDGDPDGDGSSNALEYIAGSNPAAVSPPASVSGSLRGSEYTCTFKRADLSETPDITLTVESGSDLHIWRDVYDIGPTTDSSSPGVTVTENGFAPDTISVSFPANGARLFWRIKVTATP